MHGRRLAVGVALAVLGLTACQPTLFIPAPSTPCYVGTFTLKALKLPSTIPTPVGPESLTVQPGGTVTLTMTETTWDLSVSEDFTASGNFTGSVSVDGHASGTLFATDGAIDFTLTDISGSAHVSGTLNGRPIDTTLSLPGTFIDQIVGLHGEATYRCGSDGLSVVFTSFQLEF